MVVFLAGPHRRVCGRRGQVVGARAILELTSSRINRKFITFLLVNTHVIQINIMSEKLPFPMSHLTEGYCCPTPQCQNLCVPHAFFEGKKARVACGGLMTNLFWRSSF